MDELRKTYPKTENWPSSKDSPPRPAYKKKRDLFY